MTDALEIQANISDSCCRLSLVGWIDSSNSHLLEQWLDENLDKGYKRIIFCCRELQFVSSAGIRIFLAALRRVASLDDCELLFADIGESVMDVFTVTGLIRLINRLESNPSIMESVNELS